MSGYKIIWEMMHESTRKVSRGSRELTIELPKYLMVSNTSGNIPATTIYHQWSSATLQAIDLQGKVVIKQEVANTGVPLHMSVSHLPAEMYQFRLMYHGKPVAGSKVVVK